MKTIITIIGRDRVGIVARVSAALAAGNVNILDINQNIVHGFFNMVMVVDLAEAKAGLKELQDTLKDIGTELGLEIKAQHEDIFNLMHRV
jgi:ACT domain-containing protein